jgi:hypothetical protein
MTGKQIRAMIASLEQDREIYLSALNKYNGRSSAQAQIAETCRSMTCTMIDMWKAALEAMD